MLASVQTVWSILLIYEYDSNRFFYVQALWVKTPRRANSQKVYFNFDVLPFEFLSEHVDIFLQLHNFSGLDYGLRFRELGPVAV